MRCASVDPAMNRVAQMHKSKPIFRWDSAAKAVEAITTRRGKGGNLRRGDGSGASDASSRSSFRSSFYPLAVMIGPQTATIVREASGVGSSRYMSVRAAIVER